MDQCQTPDSTSRGSHAMAYALSQACFRRDAQERDRRHVAQLRATVAEVLGAFASPILQATWEWILAPHRRGRQAHAAESFGIGATTFVSRLFRAGVSSPALWRRRVNVVRVAMLAEDPRTTWSILADVLNASSAQGLNRQIVATSGNGLKALRYPACAAEEVARFRRQLVAECAAWKHLDIQIAARGLKDPAHVIESILRVADAQACPPARARAGTHS